MTENEPDLLMREILELPDKTACAFFYHRTRKTTSDNFFSKVLKTGVDTVPALAKLGCDASPTGLRVCHAKARSSDEFSAGVFKLERAFLFFTG